MCWSVMEEGVQEILLDGVLFETQSQANKPEPVST